MTDLSTIKQQFQLGLISSREFIIKVIDAFAKEPVNLDPDAEPCQVFGDNGYLDKLQSTDTKVDKEYYDLAWDIFKSL